MNYFWVFDAQFNFDHMHSKYTLEYSAIAAIHLILYTQTICIHFLIGFYHISIYSFHSSIYFVLFAIHTIHAIGEREENINWLEIPSKNNM